MKAIWHGLEWAPEGEGRTYVLVRDWVSRSLVTVEGAGHDLLPGGQYTTTAGTGIHISARDPVTPGRYFVVWELTPEEARNLGRRLIEAAKAEAPPRMTMRDLWDRMPEAQRQELETALLRAVAIGGEEGKRLWNQVLLDLFEVD